MHLRLPVVLLSAFALIAPAAAVDAKDKGKDKHKDKHEQKSDDKVGSDDRHDDRDRDRDRDDERDHRRRDGKITICHIPPGNRAARHTITVGESAWAAHSGHGDHRGACGRTQHDGAFNRLDTNNDGVISAGEWVGDRGSFGRIDRNNDGVISRDEYSRR